MLLLTIVALTVSTLFGGSTRPQPPTLEDIQFTAEEVALLQRIQVIEENFRVARSILAAAPFLQLLASPSPEDMLITVTSTEWDLMAESITVIDVITACEIVKAIDLHRIKRPFRGKAKQFFAPMYENYNARCSPPKKGRQK